MGLSYEESKKKVFWGLLLLGVVTLIEVGFSLFGKGYLIGGVEEITVVAYIIGIILIALSLYKAYFIIYEFMHLRYEVRGMAMSILLPTMLLVWAIIAFFQEGDSWKARRALIKQKNETTIQPGEATSQQVDTYRVNLESIG